MIGKVFNRLVVLCEGEPYLNPNTKVETRRFLCQCSCGNIKTTSSQSLMKGLVQSCGCLQKERTMAANTRHGEKGTRFYNIWIHMNQRCKNKNTINYHNYGGRGITVCNRWDSDFQNSFENFKFDMLDGYHNTLSIDRIDVNGDYEPSNCRWATTSEQARNKRDSSAGKSGVTGVTEQPSRYIATYYTKESRRQKTKSFSRRTLGDELALFAATEFRKLTELKFLGGIS